MTGLFGFFGPPVPPDDLRSIAARMAGIHDDADRKILFGTRGFIGVRPGATTPELHAHDGATIALGGMPRIANSDVSRTDSAAEGVRQLVAAYRKHGSDALASVSGSFCLAVVDERQETVLLAIDRVGIEQLFYMPVGGGIAFASSIDLLARHPRIAPKISAQALFDYIYFHEIPSPVSVYEGMARLRPGEFVAWNQQRLERAQHARLEFDEARSAPFAALKDEFIGTLGSAVKDSASGVKAGAFLSGGTDSSTIVGLLGKSLGAPPDTYSIGFEAEGYDEMEYARLAARHFGARHHEYYVTPDDVVAAIPELARIFDQPFGNSSAVPAYYCARLAREDGVERMIGGDGGDELFGGNARYATQHVLSFYENIPQSLRDWIVEPVARRLPMNVAPLRKIRRYVEQAAIPMPARTETYNLLHRFGNDRIFANDVLRRVDTGQPLALQSEAYFNPSAKSLINRQLAMDMKFTLADNDIPKVVRACELAGLPVAFPMLDSRVVDFALRLEPRLKLKGTTLRYFFKEALRGFLPDAIISKQKHGFGLPFGPWVLSHGPLRELTFDSLSGLRQRRIFNDAMIDRLPAQLQEHPPYYGSLVWILMMLEQWFQHHAPTANGGSL